MRVRDRRTKESKSVAAALDLALQDITLRDADSAAVSLAMHYATQIDNDPESLRHIGHRLLETLSELGMTPKARSGVIRGGSANDGGVGAKLDELRAARERRTAHMDASS